MRGCWNPNPDTRREPQAVMRDMNQLLYRVFNSRKVHTYMTIGKGLSCHKKPTRTPKRPLMKKKL